jgi:hypothetical protein
MAIPCTPRIARLGPFAAYSAAVIFVLISGSLNVVYGLSKAADLPGKIIWASLAAAVAVVFALSWPALIRSVEARRWSAALMALVALLLAGGYSVTAALGSAAGNRMQAERTESASAGSRDRTQAFYDAAKAELATLKPARAVAELEALAARQQCRIVVTNGRRDTVCGPPPAVLAELGRAKRRAELEGTMQRASDALASGPAKVANSDAKALARYLTALGLDVGAERLNDLLVLLAVLMVECGGGLALSVGMALAATRCVGAETPETERSEGASLVVPGTAPNTLNTAAPSAWNAERGASKVFRTPSAQRLPPVQDANILAIVRAAGGSLQTSTRRLGVQLGRPGATVHAELRRLAGAGLVMLNADSRGTRITLAPTAQPN